MARKDAEARLKAPADFAGPVEQRGCTDVLCTLLLVAMWASMTAIGVYSIQEGDVRLVSSPMDYSGNLCGVNNEGRNGTTRSDMTAFPYLYYVNVGALTGVCVAKCPDLNPTDNKNLTSVDFNTLVTYDGLFQPPSVGRGNSTHERAADAIVVADYSSSEFKKTCTEDACYPGLAVSGDLNVTSAFVGEGVNHGFGYAFFAMDTTEFLNRCVPKADAVSEVLDKTGVDEVLDFVERFPFLDTFFGDCWRARNWILGFGFPVAMLIGFVFLYILGIPGILSSVVWGSILLTNALVYGVGGYAYWQADTWESADPVVKEPDTIRNTRIVAYVFFGLGVLFTLLMCYIRKEIMLSLGTVKETAKAIEQMPAITLFPFAMNAGIIVFFVIWMYYALWIASLGTIETKVVANPFNDLTYPSRSFEYDENTTYMGWYHLFCLFWTYEFIAAMGQIIVAMSIAKWYFTRDKSTISSLTVISSIKKSFFYHAGTAAFGGLILAIISIIRAIIAKIQKEAKATENKCAEAVACSCACCFWCLDNCVRFLNKHAYVQTAIFGTSFCTSAKEAFFLILRNAFKVGTLHYVSAAVCTVGRIFITGVTTLSCYALMENLGAEEYVVNLMGPAVLVAILSWVVGSNFVGVFEFGVSTVLMCFIADDEMFEEGQAFAEGSLKTLIDDWETIHKKKSDDKKKSNK